MYDADKAAGHAQNDDDGGRPGRPLPLGEQAEEALDLPAVLLLLLLHPDPNGRDRRRRMVTAAELGLANHDRQRDGGQAALEHHVPPELEAEFSVIVVVDHGAGLEIGRPELGVGLL